MESELQSKVKSLNEHQSKVDKMEEELMEIAKRQKHMFYFEVRSEIGATLMRMEIATWQGIG